MNRLSLSKRAQILGMLVEGTSLRSTSRMADVSINTVTKLLIDLGQACSAYQDSVFKELPCKRIQVDEIWSFCYAKQKNVPDDKKNEFGYGDVWTWTAICADTKLVPSWLVGDRDSFCAKIFIKDLARRLSSRIQLTSDGHKAYIEAVDSAFGEKVDYAMLVKIYGEVPESEKASSSEAVGIRKNALIGNPDEKYVSTSFAERQNLTMRMSMRRFTRKTNGFSKKVENHAHAVAIHFMYYNFGRIHKTLRVTPAMEAGISDHVWDLQKIVKILD